MLKIHFGRGIKASLVILIIIALLNIINHYGTVTATTCKYTSTTPTSALKNSLCTGSAQTTCCSASHESYLIVVARTQSATTTSECSSLLQKYFCAGCLESNQQYFSSNIPMQYVTPCKSQCNKMKELCVGDNLEIQALKNLDCSSLPDTNCWSS